jgi:hypothetical protein
MKVILFAGSDATGVNSSNEARSEELNSRFADFLQ